MVSFSSICLDAPLIITARPGIYHFLILAWIFLSESAFYPRRLASESSRPAHKFIPHRRAEGRYTWIGPHISHMTTRGCSRRRCMYPMVLTPIRRLPYVSWTRIGPYEMERLERSRRRWRPNRRPFLLSRDTFDESQWRGPKSGLVSRYGGVMRGLLRIRSSFPNSIPYSLHVYRV